MSIQTLGRLSTLTHHAYDDLLLPLWEEIFRDEDHWMSWAWDMGFIVNRFSNVYGQLYTPDDVKYSNTIDGFVLKSDENTVVERDFAGPMTDAFRQFLDSRTTPEKRGVESTYWKRAVEFQTRTTMTSSIFLECVSNDIPWIQSRLDENDIPVVEWIEWRLPSDTNVRVYHRKNTEDFTRSKQEYFTLTNDVFGGLIFSVREHIAGANQRDSVFCFEMQLTGKTVQILVDENLTKINFFENNNMKNHVRILYRQNIGYGFAVHPNKRYICYIDDERNLAVFDCLEYSWDHKFSTAPIADAELYGKLYWSPDGSHIYMSYKSGIVVYSFKDPKQPKFHAIPNLIDFELSHDGSTLFCVTDKEYQLLETSFNTTSRVIRRPMSNQYGYLRSCFQRNRPYVYIVEGRLSDGFCRIVTEKVFTSLISTPILDTR